MDATLERTEEITDVDLEAEIRTYEMIYGISTAELMQMIAVSDPRLETIEDAGFWRLDVEALERLRSLPEQPEITDEDPNRVLVHFDTSRFGTLLPGSRIRDKGREGILRPYFDLGSGKVFWTRQYVTAISCERHCSS